MALPPAVVDGVKACLKKADSGSLAGALGDLLQLLLKAGYAYTQRTSSVHVGCHPSNIETLKVSQKNYLAIIYYLVLIWIWFGFHLDVVWIFFWIFFISFWFHFHFIFVWVFFGFFWDFFGFWIFFELFFDFILVSF